MKFNKDDIVLFVGANNVGKSRTLKDIQSKILSDFQDETVLIDKIIHSERQEVYSKLGKMEDLHEQGDGIRSAVAILASLIVKENSLYLIDEPETFYTLHRLDNLAEIL